MKNFFIPFIASIFCVYYTYAQCTSEATLMTSTTPEACSPATGGVLTDGNAIVATTYFANCQTVCVDVGLVDNGGGGVTADCAPGGASNNDDFWLFAPDPYTGGNPYSIPGTGIPGYDGSLVFSWQDYPGYPDFAPTMAVHVSAAIPSFSVLPNCTDGFTYVVPFLGIATEFANVICEGAAIPYIDNNQIIAGSGTIPVGSDINTAVSYLNYWFQIIPNPSAPVGTNYCFDVSPYVTGFICSDPITIATAAVSTTHEQGTYNDLCLCSSAANGGLFNTHSNPSFNPGVIDPYCSGSTNSTAWFKVNAPYSCNQITSTVTSGTGNFNIVILSNVNCPLSEIENPFIAGDMITVYQDSLNTDRVIQGGGCATVGDIVSTDICNTLAAGEYWICISGESVKGVFDMQVDIYNTQPEAGTLADASTISICSGSTITLATTGTLLPGAIDCGQSLEWVYSTIAGFDPTTSGTTLGTGTSISTSALVNTTCAAITYYVTAHVAGTCADQTAYKQIIVYPTLDATDYAITTDADDCTVTITPACPLFEIDGVAGAANYSTTMGGVWTVPAATLTNPGAPASCASLIIPESNHDCGIVTCTTPTVTFASAICNAMGTGYTINITITSGTASTFIITDNDATTTYTESAAIIGTTYTFGPYANSSIVAITVTDGDDATCFITSASYSTPCACPIMTDAISDVTSACHGSDIVLNATISDPSGVGGTVSWIDNSTGGIIGTGTSTSVSTSNLTCGVNTLNISAVYTPTGGGCPETTIDLPTIMVYPSANPTFTYSNVGCTITAEDLTCPGGSTFAITGGNTAGNIYDAIDPSSGDAVFTFVPIDASSPCAAEILTVPYNCGGACPTLVSAQSSSILGIECAGTEITLSVTLAPAGSIYAIEWVGPYGYVSTDNSPVVTLLNDKCYLEDQNFFYTITCLTDSSVIATGSVPIAVNPSPQAQIFGANTCSVSVTSQCIGELGEITDIYWGGNPANGNTFNTYIDGDNGILTYTLIQGNTSLLCTSTIDIPYNCEDPCVPDANGTCVIMDHDRSSSVVLPYICYTETSGVYASVAAYDNTTGLGMSVGAGHEVGFILTDQPDYTYDDFAMGIPTIISYSEAYITSPMYQGNFGSDSIATIYQNMPLYIYAVSLEAPFTAFQWSSSSCGKVSAPAEVIFLRPILSTLIDGCNVSEDIIFNIVGGLFDYTGTLPVASEISLTDGSTIYTASEVIDAGTTPPSYNVIFTGIAPSTTGDYTLSILDQNACTEVTSFNCVLALNLTNFYGIGKLEYNSIKWSLENEDEMESYTLAHSNDGVNFTYVAMILAENKHAYEYNDIQHLENRMHYYRLSTKDISGTINHSNIIAIDRTSTESFIIINVYPIPTQDLLSLQISSIEKQNVSIDILDITNKIVAINNLSIEKGHNIISLSTKLLPVGLYFIRLQTARETRIIKMIKN